MSRKRDICTKRNTNGRGRQRMHEDRRSHRFWLKCRLWSTMTSGRSFAEQQNSQEFFLFYDLSPFFLSNPHNKIRKNFFLPSACSIPIHLSLSYDGSTHAPIFILRLGILCFYSRHRLITSPTCRVLPFVPKRPRHVLRAFLFPLPIRRLFHVVSLLRHPYMSSTRSPCMKLPIVP